MNIYNYYTYTSLPTYMSASIWDGESLREYDIRDMKMYAIDCGKSDTCDEVWLFTCTCFLCYDFGKPFVPLSDIMPIILTYKWMCANFLLN